MSFDISALSGRFTVRRLNESDAPAMLALSEKNTVYYRYHAPAPSLEDMREGLTALPPGKTMAELTPAEKNAISHRFHALQDLSSQIAGDEA